MSKRIVFLFVLLLLLPVMAYAQEATPMPDMTPLPSIDESGVWVTEEIFGVTDLMKEVWIPGLEGLRAQPELWPTYPNIPNLLVPEFRVVPFEVKNAKGEVLSTVNTVPDGIEYGEDLSSFCQQDQRCDFQTAARHYRSYSGDYNFPGVGEECHSDEGQACTISVWNVGDVTSVYRDQTFDLGFTVTGRYWNGDVLHVAMNALTSHVAANMLDMFTMASPLEVLNAGVEGNTNAGANCSVPEACKWVDARIVVVSGNEVLWKAYTKIYAIEG